MIYIKKSYEQTAPHNWFNQKMLCIAYRCAIHWCGMNTRLAILMSWVRPDREILPRPYTHTGECSTLWCCYGGSQSEARWKVYRTHWVLNPGPVVCESITLSTSPQLLLIQHLLLNSKNRASCPLQGTVNGGAVSKWPGCRWDVKHNQLTIV